MKNILEKYLKRIILYLIPLFFISNEKYTTCNDISILSEYKDIDQELDIICSNNKKLCIMIDAIKYSFNILNTFSQSVEIKNESYHIGYENVNSNSIKCGNISETIEIKEDNEEYIFSFSNCTSTLEGKLKVNGTEFQNSTELYLDKITIFMNKTSIIGDMHILIEYDDKNFYYDKKFVDENFTKGMDEIMKNVFKNYTNQLKNIIELDENQLLSQIKYFSDISNQFAKEYSYIKQNLKDNESKITYIAYNKFEYGSLINIYDHIYIPNITIFFEYALNYNITYHEGSFMLDYMNFSKSKNDVYIGNIRDNSSEFNERVSIEESKEIWDTIKKDFREKFKEYK